jgi:biotin synthase-like enzyme
MTEETGMGVSLSVGELPDEHYQQLREAGAKIFAANRNIQPEFVCNLAPSRTDI